MLFGNIWLYSVIPGYIRWFPVIFGNNRLYSVIPGYIRWFPVVFGNNRLFSVIYGIQFDISVYLFGNLISATKKKSRDPVLLVPSGSHYQSYTGMLTKKFKRLIYILLKICSNQFFFCIKILQFWTKVGSWSGVFSSRVSGSSFFRIQKW